MGRLQRSHAEERASRASPDDASHRLEKDGPQRKCRHESSFSRRAASEFSFQHTLIGNRGRREGRVIAAPMAPVRKKMHGAGTTGTSRSTGLPCAMGLRLIRDLPGDQALLSSPRIISRNLTPAQGRQDHTISPSASCRSSDDTSRPSHPAANVRDDRDTPLMWLRDAGSIVLICPTAQEKSL